MCWGESHGMVLGGRKMDEIKLTQEQLDALINEKVSKAKEGLFDETELQKRVTSEVDRRVDSGIKKGIETQKEKWEREFAERAKLSAEELARKDFEDKLNQMTQKEKEIQKKANLIEARDMLSSAGVPKSHYENLIGMLVSDNEESTKASVQNFINSYNATKAEIETKVKSELSHIKAPAGTPANGTVTKAEFDKMGYADKMKFKQSNPEMYKQFIK